MDMKRHMLNFFFIFMLMDRVKERGSYKMKVVTKKDGKQLLKKINRIK